MIKKLSAIAANYLKEALCSIYWYKNDLRFFIDKCIYDKNIINSVNWENYKRQIVSDIINIMYENQEKYLGDLRRVLYEVCQMDSFYHLQTIICYDNGLINISKSANRKIS